MIEELFVDLVGENTVVQGFVAGLVIAGFNLLGATVVLAWRNPTEKWLDAALGFAAGVMLSASFTSLLLPGIEFAARPEYTPVRIGGVALVGIVPVLIGFGLGVALLDRGQNWIHYAGPVVGNRLFRRNGGVEDTVPPRDDVHRERIDPRRFGDHLRIGDDSPADGDDSPTPDASNETSVAGESDGSEEGGLVDERLTGVLLFTVAITLHNMPEGLAVGVGFGSGDVSGGIALMIAIGLQNVPEGLAVSVAAVNAGLARRWYAAVAGIRAGLVEVPLAVVGAWAVSVAAPLLPYAMGFAAGGMLYVIGDEIVPETHSRGYERVATLGLLAGAAVMLTLDVVLG
ncbi:ZIP family metal transporter [Halobaculum sp. MBLA0143]|uniref:ZIP family metal transporter n=1 Tax=Halobaculum sp. MBLA0143 TaxID=3079933 RepID=UPI0035253CB0